MNTSTKLELEPRIEVYDPSFLALVDPAQPIVELASNMGGPGGPVEGTVWVEEEGHLLFNDIQNDIRYKFHPVDGVSVVRTPNGHANGQTRDRQGRLVTCDYDTRQVTRHEFDGTTTVVANNFQGKRLARPNDVVVRSDGSTYFTDPIHSIVPEPWSVQLAAVYRVAPDLGAVSLLINDFVTPNGIAFSPDEKTLYIGDWRRKHIRAFELLPTGMLVKSSDRIFVDLDGPDPGRPDGMKVDVGGNVYVGGAGGIYVVDPSGKKLGRIVHGHAESTNMAFGDADWQTLYFTSRNSLFSLRLKVPGVKVPARNSA